MKWTVVVVAALGRNANADVCPPGYLQSVAPTALCLSNTDSCAATCCGVDATKCSSESGTWNYCSSSQYMDMDSMGMTKSTTACCSDRVTCSTSGMSCPTGYVDKTGVANSMCPSNAESCLNTCCDVDSTTCAGTWQAMAACTGNLYSDTSKYTNTAGSTTSDYESNCCSTKETCGNWAGSCPASAMITGVSTTNCAGGSDTCAATCCTPDTTKCGNIWANCPSSHYQDGDKAGATAGTTSAEQVAACCTTKATCQDFINAAASSGMRSRMGDLAILTLIASWMSK